MFKKNKGWLVDSLNCIHHVYQISKPIIESNKRVNKLEEFNNLKNTGFYVDFKDQILIPNKIIKHKEYKEVEETINRISNYFEELKELLSSELNDQIKEKREDIRIFIDDALSDYSFK